MNYFIGMDGGGTKTKCVLTDEHKKVMYECTGGPSTFLLQGVEKVSETLYSLVEECVEKTGINYSDIQAVVLGTTGAGRRPDAELMEKGFIAYLTEKGRSLNIFRVESDARIALEGAFAGKPGSILIAGTGSIMFGKDEKGVIHRVGGFGRFIGDEGSGYMIGRKGLMAAAKSFDGRGASTLLTNYLEEEHGIDSAPKLISAVYQNGLDIASIAPLVIKAAENGDEICEALIDEESENLVLHLRAMKKQMEVSGMNVSLIGGTITSDNFYARTFKEKVAKYLTEVQIIEAEYPPHTGAVIMAMDLAG